MTLQRFANSHKFTITEEVLGDGRVTAGGVKDGITVACLLKANGLPDLKTWHRHPGLL